MWVFFLLLINVIDFELFSQVSDVAHGPLVQIKACLLIYLCEKGLETLFSLRGHN